MKKIRLFSNIAISLLLLFFLIGLISLIIGLLNISNKSSIEILSYYGQYLSGSVGIWFSLSATIAVILALLAQKEQIIIMQHQSFKSSIDNKIFNLIKLLEDSIIKLKFKENKTDKLIKGHDLIDYIVEEELLPYLNNNINKEIIDNNNKLYETLNNSFNYIYSNKHYNEIIDKFVNNSFLIFKIIETYDCYYKIWLFYRLGNIMFSIFISQFTKNELILIYCKLFGLGKDFTNSSLYDLYFLGIQFYIPYYKLPLNEKIDYCQIFTDMVVNSSGYKSAIFNKTKNETKYFGEIYPDENYPDYVP